jgi:hypothetical protein
VDGKCCFFASDTAPFEHVRLDLLRIRFAWATQCRELSAFVTMMHSGVCIWTHRTSRFLTEASWSRSDGDTAVSEARTNPVDGFGPTTGWVDT